LLAAVTVPGGVCPDQKWRSRATPEPWQIVWKGIKNSPGVAALQK